MDLCPTTSQSCLNTPFVLVTCGPGHSRVDSVRRITNFSTGAMGSALCRALQERDLEVACFRGDGATVPLPDGVKETCFGTNSELVGKIRSLRSPPHVVFHAAALADFAVDPGSLPEGGKIRSSGPLTISLVPELKILPQLRDFFPQAHIVGWKYEVDGSHEEAIQKGRDQLTACRTDACVVNGPAHGPGFSFVSGATPPRFFENKGAVSKFLATWASVKLLLSPNKSSGDATDC